MILYHWRGPARNFGDELNTLLWPRLLPGFFDQDPSARFLGIGSVLDGRHDPAALKVVAGSGYGGYEKPIALDHSWSVHWVRGPHTARLLGLTPAFGIGDPGSLLPLAGLAPTVSGQHIGFMPHFESAMRGAWSDAAMAAGVTLIDPRGDPAEIMAAIGTCRVLISEALHGVIAADAWRIPWIAIEPLAPIHRPKWADWAATLDLTIAFRRLAPSTTLEYAHLTRLSGFHTGRGLLDRHAGRLRRIARGRRVERAADALRRATSAEPQLSDPSNLRRAQTRMMEAIAVLRRAPPPAWNPATGQRWPAVTPLHQRADFAYDQPRGHMIA